MAMGTRWDWLTVDREECEDITKDEGEESGREIIALGQKQVESKE